MPETQFSANIADGRINISLPESLTLESLVLARDFIELVIRSVNQRICQRRHEATVETPVG